MRARARKAACRSVVCSTGLPRPLHRPTPADPPARQTALPSDDALSPAPRPPVDCPALDFMAFADGAVARTGTVEPSVDPLAANDNDVGRDLELQEPPTPLPPAQEPTVNPPCGVKPWEEPAAPVSQAEDEPMEMSPQEPSPPARSMSNRPAAPTDGPGKTEEPPVPQEPTPRPGQNHVVRLKSRQEEIFEVDKEVACRSTTVNNMLNDTGSETPVPLPMVDSAILAKVRPIVCDRIMCASLTGATPAPVGHRVLHVPPRRRCG